ncbi:hypothetical protein [Haladaptatus caseinilyticus]|uniref:hypothetical protein n=1 Tax=Haladaptatus caseinilyticus TaxID=2993314 RepID=UPI00224AB9FD|nr:hypothetical protein [Haladaptatus caseinilyticus]
MRDRAEHVYTDTSIRAFTLAKEDMFLLKGVAGRGYDPEDMLTLIRTGLSFEIVRTELEQQLPVNRGTVEARQVLDYAHPLMTLEQTISRFDGLPSTFTDEVGRLADQAFTEREVLVALTDGERPIDDVCREIVDKEQSVDDTDTVEAAIDRLEEKQIVVRERKRVSIAESVSIS